MTPTRNEAADVVGAPLSTSKRGEGEAMLRKRFDAWEYGQQWHEALDDAIARRIDAALAAEREPLLAALRALVASLTFADEPRPIGQQGREINAAIAQARALIEQYGRTE